MAKRYNPKDIEPKWQKTWEESKIYQATDDPSKPKKYILEYFPYPSGAAMHVGHVRNYTIGDAISRFNRMRGYNVLHPMGWDAFGLPAENYAIKTGVSPRQAIDANTKRFKEQLMQMGFSYDWSREIDSTDPKYYRWTQWFFLLLFKKGLAYQQESLQWWCPHDKTVLANEQVEAGKCWRCGNEVEKKSLKQWFFKITDYADRLAKDLDDINWSEGIKSMQRNWIGRSQGAEIEFVVSDQTYEVKDSLKFTPELTGLIREGKKWSTIRLEPKQLQVGDYAKLQTRFSKDEVQSFAVAKITKVQNKKLNEISLDLEGHERYETEDQKIADYKRFYGPEVTAETEFTIYDFEVVAHILTIFTTRQDTQYGVTFIVLAPEHPLVKVITTEDQRQGVEEYVKQAESKSDIERQETNREKTGVFTGAYAINPANDEAIPVWVADYVLGGYGTGVVMGVPAHDDRDHEFATKYNLEIRQVLQTDKDSDFHSEGIVINSDKYNGMRSEAMREKILNDFEAVGVAKEVVNYKMRDWLISRQRYWGAPIPIIHCPTDGAVPVLEDQLPVILPELQSFEPSGDGRSPLANIPEFVKTTCPKCGGPAERETDTMDGFACSSWYFLRFADPHNDEVPFSKEKADFWLPVDDYIGGAEHAVMHLLYARFWTKVMYDEGLINFQEPFVTLRNQGMILAPDGQKMSKSKGNTIEPDGLIDQGYGADSTRIMELFIGPWNQSAAWSVEGMGGSFRFLQRIWTITQDYIADTDKNDPNAEPDQKEAEVRHVLAMTHKVIKKVSSDLEDLGFNTAIASLMEFVNFLYKERAQYGFGAVETWKFALTTLTQLVAPFAPHIAEELWHELGEEGSVHTSEWPVHDEAQTIDDMVTIVVQVNGKVRAELQLASDATEDEAIAAAMNDEKIKTYLENKEVRKTIYVPRKLVSLVVS